MKRFILLFSFFCTIHACKENKLNCNNHQQEINETCQCIANYFGSSCEYEIDYELYGYYSLSLYQIINDTTYIFDSVNLFKDINSNSTFFASVQIQNTWAQDYIEFTALTSDSGSLKIVSITQTTNGTFKAFNNDSIYATANSSLPTGSFNLIFSKYK